MSRNALNKFRKQYPETIWLVTPEQKAKLDWFFDEELPAIVDEVGTVHVTLPRLSSRSDKRAALLVLMNMAREQFVEEQANEAAE